jgi:hypothetical protein
MRLLMIHVEHFAYEAKIETPISVKISEDEKAGECGEALLVLYSTELADESNPADAASLAALEIRSYMSKIGRKRIVLFPFAFLLSREEKSSSKTAAGMERLLVQALGEPDIDVVPFGWYKKFSITSMGHKYSVHASRVLPRDESSSTG